MATVSATASAVQSGMQQLRVQQARRTAEQLEVQAASLARQAQTAERNANRAEEEARSLSVESNRTQVAAGRARQGLAMLSTASAMRTQLATTLDQVLARNSPTSSSSGTDAASASSGKPVVNAQGELTGTLINTTA